VLLATIGLTAKHQLGKIAAIRGGAHGQTWVTRIFLPETLCTSAGTHVADSADACTHTSAGRASTPNAYQQGAPTVHPLMHELFLTLGILVFVLCSFCWAITSLAVIVSVLCIHHDHDMQNCCVRKHKCVLWANPVHQLTFTADGNTCCGLGDVGKLFCAEHIVASLFAKVRNQTALVCCNSSQLCCAAP